MIEKTDGTVSHIGQVVLETRYERHVHSDNAMIDSGEMLTVIVIANGAFEKLEFDLGRTDNRVWAEVDAPADVIAAYNARVAQAQAAHAAKLAAEATEREARRVVKGRTIKVVSGRKVAKGTTGVCIWVGEGTYGERVGLKDAAGTVHWTALTNVAVQV